MKSISNKNVLFAHYKENNTLGVSKKSSTSIKDYLEDDSIGSIPFQF